MRRLLTFTLLGLLCCGPAAAEDWRAPPEGLVVILEGTHSSIPVELEVRVVKVAGDEVTVETSGEGLQEDLHDTYFRWLISTEANGNRYDFDRAAVAALWPLEAGKSLDLPVQATGPLGDYAFRLEATVEALEPLDVPAGHFDTARVRHSLTLLDQPAELRVETLTWLDLASGVAVRTDTTIRYEQGDQTMAFSAKEIRLP